jgi:CUG-BP- and ETR3-like factor
MVFAYTLYICVSRHTQVPKNMNEEELFPTFNAFGPLKDVAIIRDKHSGLHRGCAFVTFWSPEHAENAQLSLHDQFTFPGGRRPAQVKPAEPSGKNYSSEISIHVMCYFLPLYSHACIQPPSFLSSSRK